MKITIDTDVLNQYNLSIEEALTILKIADNSFNFYLNESLLESLQERLFIKIINEDNNKIIVLRENGNNILKSLYNTQVRMVRVKPRIQQTEDFVAFVKSYRSLWKGLKVGSMGSEMTCKEKLERFMKENPNITKDQILKASSLYIQSLDNYTYLQQADNFIYKRDKFGESSRLSAFIDELNNKPAEDGWTNKLM